MADKRTASSAPVVRDLNNARGDQPLASNEGPLRIIVPHDKHPARSLKLLQEIDLVQLKK